jgi:hypothetical protein
MVNPMDPVRTKGRISAAGAQNESEAWAPRNNLVVARHPTRYAGLVWRLGMGGARYRA